MVWEKLVDLIIAARSFVKNPSNPANFYTLVIYTAAKEVLIVLSASFFEHYKYCSAEIIVY